MLRIVLFQISNGLIIIIDFFQSCCFREIESLKQGIEQIQNVLSTVQQSAFQLSGIPSELSQENSSGNVNDQGQTSSAEGMNMSQLEELRQMLRAAGSNLTPEQFLMSDNDENEGATKPTANKAANNAYVLFLVEMKQWASSLNQKRIFELKI